MRTLLVGTAVVVVLVAAPGSRGAAPDPPLDALAGWSSKATLDDVVTRLRSGALTGPQPVFERPNGPYRVYTSFIDRRKGAADIHEADDEIFLVLSGSARSTLGGRIVDGTRTAPREQRGTVIEGGTTRDVGPGDLVSAPRGTPHQMDPGNGHVLYVVIKVIGATVS